MHFFHSLTPVQISLIVGVFAPVLHYLLDKIRNFSTTHNWILSFLFPFLGIVVFFLVGNESFSKAFPAFAEAYAVAQSFYAVAIRYWKLYQPVIEAAPATPALDF